MAFKNNHITTVKVIREDHFLAKLKHDYKLPDNFTSVLFGDNLEIRFEIARAQVVDLIDIEYEKRKKSLLKIYINQITFNKDTNRERTKQFMVLPLSYGHKIDTDNKKEFKDMMFKIGTIIDKSIVQTLLRRLDPPQKTMLRK